MEVQFICTWWNKFIKYKKNFYNSKQGDWVCVLCKLSQNKKARLFFQ
jgi:hypothetical protein